MRTATAILALLLFASIAQAQPCVLGIYGDTQGYESLLSPLLHVPFEIYVLLQVEDAVAGVAYTIQFPDWLIMSVLSYGPSGGGLNVPSAGGANIGLGECAIGFNQNPILVASYSAIAVGVFFGVATIGPNTDEDPSYPVYASCADQLVVCEGTSDLYFETLAVDAASIGTVKALYRD